MSLLLAPQTGDVLYNIQLLITDWVVVEESGDGCLLVHGMCTAVHCLVCFLYAL
jgi:hypothetical protein